MTNILGSIVISGIVLINGRESANQLVLLLSADMTRFIASTITDIDGSYIINLNANELDTAVVLVVKIQHPILALVFRRMEIEGNVPQQDFNIDTSSKDFCTLYGEIEADQNEMPPYIEISVTPAHLKGVPFAIEKFFLRRDERVVDAAYYETKVTGHHFELKLQRGTYRISGAYIIYKRESKILPQTANYVVDKIYADGEKLPLTGERLGGYILDIEHDRHIKMHMEILSD